MKCMRKNIVWIVAFVILAASALSCKGNDENVKTDDNKYTKSSFDRTFTEDGIFLFEDKMIYYMSADTGEKTIFCFDPVCTHEPASYENPDPECMAAGEYNKTGIVYHEGYIYLVVRETYEHSIYRMDINSGVRELVVEIPYSVEYYDAMFYGEYMYYTYMVNSKEDDEDIGLVKSRGLMEVNLKDGSYRIVISADGRENVSVSQYDICDRTLFYVERNGDDRALYGLNLDTLESKLLVSPEEYKYNNYNGIYDAEKFYYFDPETEDIGLYNIGTGERQVLIKPELGDNRHVSTVVGSKGKIFYKTWEGENGTEEYFLYDIAKDKLLDITEKCREFGVYSYNPYKSMFLCYELGEDGVEILGFAAASEAMVLGQ